MSNVNYKPVTKGKCEKFLKGLNFLILDPEYKDLSTKGKVLEILIFDKFDRDKRYGKTKKDKDGHEYMEYLLDDMAADLRCSKNSVSKYKAELVNKGLIAIPKKKGKHAIYVNENIEVSKSVSNLVTYVDTKTNTTKYSFFEIPTFLLHEQYKNLTWEAILIYSLIRDRFLLSINTSSNGSSIYTDNHNHVFAYLSYGELTSMINKSEKTIAKHKDKLIAHNLIHQAKEVRSKQNGEQTIHIRYYVFEPIALPVEKKDKQQVDKIVVTNELPESDSIIWDDKNVVTHKEQQESVAKKDPVQSQKLQGSNTLSQTSTINTSSNDNEMYNDKSIESHLSNHYQSQSIDSKNYDLEKYIIHHKIKNYPKHLQVYLKQYTVKDLKIICGILCKTKNDFNKTVYPDYSFEDLEFEIINKINDLRYANHEKQESVFKRRKYIKHAFYNMFNDYHEERVEEIEQELFGGVNLEDVVSNSMEQESFSNVDPIELKNRSIKALEKTKKINDSESLEYESNKFNSEELDALGIG